MVLVFQKLDYFNEKKCLRILTRAGIKIKAKIFSCLVVASYNTN
jgi:hypothetical protein